MLVILAAVGSAALAYATELWARIVSAVMFISLLLATLTAVHAQRRLRWFANGFAIVGWLYFWFSHPVGGPLDMDLLFADTALTALYTELHGELDADQVLSPLEFLEQPRPGNGSTADEGGVTPPARKPGEAAEPPAFDDGGFAPPALAGGDLGDFVDDPNAPPSWEDFSSIGHSLFTFILGSLAGLFACVLRSRTERTPV